MNLAIVLTVCLMCAIVLLLLCIGIVELRESYKFKGFKLEKKRRPIKTYRRVYLRLCVPHFLTRGLKTQLVSVGIKNCDVCQMLEKGKEQE